MLYTKKKMLIILITSSCHKILSFPGGSELKASASNAGDLGSIPGLGRSLEKEMVTHSSILAWRIPWMEKPGRLQSTGSQRVRHDWTTSPSPSSFQACLGTTLVSISFLDWVGNWPEDAFCFLDSFGSRELKELEIYHMVPVLCYGTITVFLYKII